MSALSAHNGEMHTLALVLPQGMEYSRMIRRGVVEELEQTDTWQLLQLPFHESGKYPVPRGMASLDGIVTWADRKQKWIPELVEAGVPIVNCGGEWRDDKRIGLVVTDIRSVIRLAVAHFGELGLRKIYYFGYKVSTDPSRQRLLKLVQETAAGFQIEVDSIEARGKNPDEHLERLLVPEDEHFLMKQFRELEKSVGIYAENDYFARLACDIATRVDKEIPSDLAILGSFGELLGRFGSPTISTVPLPGKEIGKQAFQLIKDTLEGAKMPPQGISINATTIIVRESTGGQKQDIIMERVYRWIEQNALQGLTVQELPEIAGISLKALRRRYKTVHGEEPSEHIRRIRLTEAQKLLATTDSSILEVAKACGFSSQTAFYNYFLRHTGLSPSDFRNQQG